MQLKIRVVQPGKVFMFTCIKCEERKSIAEGESYFIDIDSDVGGAIAVCCVCEEIMKEK